MNWHSTLATRLPFFYGWVIVYAAGSAMVVRNAAASLTLVVFPIFALRRLHREGRTGSARKTVTMATLELTD